MANDLRYKCERDYTREPKIYVFYRAAKAWKAQSLQHKMVSIIVDEKGVGISLHLFNRRRIIVCIS